VLLNSGGLVEAKQLYSDVLSEGFEIKQFDRYLKQLADRMHMNVTT
jgi:hypothetical protein